MRRSAGGAATTAFAPGGSGMDLPGTWTKPTPNGGAGTGVPTSWSGTTRNPAGNPVPVSAAGRVSGSSAAGVIGRYARGFAGPVGAGMAIYALCQELGCFASNDDGVAGMEFGKVDPNAGWCTTGTCYRYRITNGTLDTGWVNTTSSVCSKYHSLKSATLPSYDRLIFNGYIAPGPAWPSGACHNTIQNINTGQTADHTVGMARETRPYDTGTPPLIPMTTQELEDMIAAKSGWPSTSKIGDALMDGLSSIGETVKPDMTSLSGPAKTPGKSSTTTTTNPDGSQRIESRVCEYMHAYNSSTMEMTTHEECKVTVTNNGQQGNTTTETQTDTTPEKNAEEEAKERTCTDTPDAPECGTFDTPTSEVPKSTKSANYAAENLGFGGGSCPASPTWTDRLGTHTLNMAPICDAITSWVRPLVLAMAALMALAIAIPREGASV